jgi:peptidoglycan/LPS O-acetylase OafA/YrhL
MEAYPCVMDSIAAGSLLAVIRPRLAAIDWYRRFLRSPWFWIVPIGVVLLNTTGRVAFDYITDITAMNIGIALCVDRFTQVDAGPSYWLLNTRALVWIGTLSYSLYLWQEPFLNHNAHTAMTTWPFNLGLAFLCAVASYYLVEKPFFALRDHWAQRRAARRRDTAAP